MSWKEMKDKILEAVEQVQVENKEEYLMKVSIMMYIYRSLESEETFNKNCSLLNEELNNKKLGLKKK